MPRCFRESQMQQSSKVALSGNQSIIKIMATTQNLQNFTLKLFGLWYSYKWHQMILSTRWQVYTSSLFFSGPTLSNYLIFSLILIIYFYRFLNYYASHVTISNQNRFRNFCYRFDIVIIVLVISNNNS